MKPNKTPLVLGFDPKAPVCDALAAALHLVAGSGGELHLVHAVDLPESVWASMSTEWAARARAEMLADAEQRVEQAVARAFATLGATRPAGLRHEVDLGHPARVLGAACERVGASMVVVGPHIKEHVLNLGSVPRALLAEGPPSVWVQRGVFRVPKRILVPVDLSPLSLAALARARELARQSGGTLHVLHCFRRPDFFPTPDPGGEAHYPTYVVDQTRDKDEVEFRELERSFDWAGVPHELEFVEGEPIDEVLAREAQADLLVVGTHGRTGLARFLLGNVAASVLGRAKGAVLAVRPDA
ncbi:MAG: hypothetical protein GC161_12110 [Planctomycetaceae bacterium]|nr:hypothetical protein [Planctomycetaceae bacterium]